MISIFTLPSCTALLRNYSTRVKGMSFPKAPLALYHRSLNSTESHSPHSTTFYTCNTSFCITLILRLLPIHFCKL